MRRNDLLSNALLLLRHTGMRTGMCRSPLIVCALPGPISGPSMCRWVSSNPTWVPWTHGLSTVNSSVLCAATAPNAGRLLCTAAAVVHVDSQLRATLQDVVAVAGILAHIVHPKFRHYGIPDYAEWAIRGSGWSLRFGIVCAPSWPCLRE